jgi:hypothetical protein
MKHTILLLLILSATADVWAQAKFPYDSVRHTVIYTESFKLSSKVKTDEVYAAALKWFGDSAKFNHKNADPPIDTLKAKRNKKKKEAEEQFNNPRPLQMQDPVGGRVQGMGIIRYFGSANSTIKLLYVKYDIAVKVQAGLASIAIENIHYFHYHPTSYKQVALYNFSGGKPCEEVGTLESLIGCENFRDEFKNLALYCNKYIYGNMDDFKNMLKQKKYLLDQKPATTGVKAPVKSEPKRK